MCCDCETMVSGYIISCCLQRRCNSIPQCRKETGRHTARFHQRALRAENGEKVGGWEAGGGGGGVGGGGGGCGGGGVTTFLKHYPDAKQHTSGMTGGH